MIGWARRRPVVSTVLLGLVLVVVGITVWRVFGGTVSGRDAERERIRFDLAATVDEAALLAQLAGPDPRQIRSGSGGEAVWRDRVAQQIERLRERIEQVDGQPGAQLLSQRGTFVLRRAAARLEKFRTDIRRRANTIQQSACSVARQSTREIAALDGELPERCVGIGSNDCGEFVRAYMTHLGVPDDVCAEKLRLR